MRPKLTYANVMATVAVFIALGGASYAATQIPKRSVGSRQLKPSAVKTGYLAKNAVKVGKIDLEAVRAGKLAKTSIATDRLRGQAVTNEKLAENSVTSAKIADGAVGSRALNGLSQLTASGMIPAGAARRPFYASCAIPGNDPKAEWLAGARAISGGFETDSPGVHVESSRLDGFNRWFVWATNEGGEAATVTVFVYCLSY
jgi:hypothetical protein